MRRSRFLSIVAGVALLAACGDSNGPSNSAPKAAFTASCTSLDCTFTDGSTDSDGSIASWSWTFGDAGTASSQNPAHAYQAAGSYDVALTVTDNDGASKTVTRQVTVSAQANVAPTADFSFTCTNLDCTFVDQSFDSDAGGAIAFWTWDFGDGQTSTAENPPTHTYAAAGTYTVKLTVEDNFTAADSKTEQVTVTAPQSGAPSATFEHTCSSLDCTFTDQSTDVGSGTIVSWAWDFGDGQTSTAQNPGHSYNVTTVTSYTVKLTVTDNDNLTSTSTKQISVAPPATLTCNGAACTLGLDQASTVLVTLVSSSCTAHGNQFVITAPINDTLFTDGCYATVGTTFPLNGGAVFAQGTQLDAEVLSGLSGTLKLATDPALRVTGDFTNGWTLEFDDGAGGPGEPDFNDLIILIKATPSGP